MYDAERFAYETDVSRETCADFVSWQTLLNVWNKRINLVGKRTIDQFWQRHALDSWQLWREFRKFDMMGELKFIDLGSGAGFPGIALAIGCKQVCHGHVDLVEVTGKKAQFLRRLVHKLELPAQVVEARIEQMSPKAYDIVSARALAPLPKLFTYAQRFWKKDTIGLFLKGQNVDRELTEAQKYWTYDCQLKTSCSDVRGVIVVVKNLKRI